MLMKTIIDAIRNDTILQLVVLAVMMDTIFGVLRAIKERKFNSNFGIDGALRKIAMLVSLMFLVIIDHVVGINAIGWLPAEIRSYVPNEIGISDFFGILYLCYETVSILKNMSLCGLPVRGIWTKVRVYLGKFTDELPDND